MGKHCFLHQYGNYATLENSKQACIQDDNCLGVYDNDCDNEPPFTLCPTSKTDYDDSNHSPLSCVYNKLGNLSL